METCKFPPELVMQVLSHLPKHDILSFSLTCKAFYYLFLPKQRTLSTSTLERFLATLERDLPDLHYCHMCVQLHAWRHEDPIQSTTWWASGRTEWEPHCLFGPRGSNRQGVRYGKLSGAGVCKGLTLNFHDARLVMNAHLYGPSYGRPLSSIEHTDPFAHHSIWPPRAKPPSIIETNSTWRFRVVDDELLLKAEYTIRQLQGNEKHLYDWMTHCDRIICHHLHLDSVSNEGIKCVSNRIPEMEGQGRTVTDEREYFRRRDESKPHRSCYICFTDYEVTIRNEAWPHGYNTPPGCSTLPRGPARAETERTHAQGVVIRITTYQNFGAVRSPWDRKWAAMTNARLVTCPRALTHEPGAIERMWKRDEDAPAGSGAVGAVGGGGGGGDGGDRPNPARALWVLPEAKVNALLRYGILNRRNRVQGPNGKKRFVEDRYGRRREDEEEEEQA